MGELSKKLLRYGKITSDTEVDEDNGYRRIRTIRLNDKIYYHHMFNGKIVEIFEI